jgi:hypothetical protein
MHHGRIRNLEQNLRTKLEDLEATTAMVTAERVAVLVVDR